MFETIIGNKTSVEINIAVEHTVETMVTLRPSNRVVIEELLINNK